MCFCHMLIACDFCNCYLGLNPQYKKNIVGLRTHYKLYNGTHHDLAEFSDAALTNKDFWEKRTEVELHAQWYPVQKLQIIFSLPYIYNIEGMSAPALLAFGNHHHDNENENNSAGPISGFGDPLIIAQYQLFNKTNSDTNKLSHRLFAGGGVKFPLGKYKLGDNADPLDRTHQPGSGSFDFIASATYLAKIKRAGFNVNVSYLQSTMNNESFQFGNRFNANAIFYYQCNISKTLFFPNIGSFVEQSQKDWTNNYYIDNSGGQIIYAHAGLDFYFNKLSLNTAVQLPVHQKLNSPQPEMKYRIITGISVALN